MILGFEHLGVDEIVGQLGIAELVAPHLHGVILDLFLGAGAVFLQHLAGVGIGEDRLDARRDVAGVKADRAGGGDGGQQGVADAVFGHGGAHIFIHRLHGAAGEIGVGVEEGEGALFLGQFHRGEIGGAGDAVHPALGLFGGLFRAVAHALHQKGIGEAGDAKADAALGLGFLPLLFQREVRDIDHVVHHPDGGADQFIQFGLVHMGRGLEGLAHQPGQVDRAQQAGAIGRQGLFATGVGGRDRLAIGEVVGLVDAVDEDHAGFGEIIGGLHDPVPQVAGLDGVVDLAAETQLPRAVGLHGLHEGIGDQDRKVEHPQAGGVGLGGDEVLDIGVVAAHGGHHGAAAGAGGHDGAAHRIPHVHEGQGAAGVGGDAFHLGAAWADGGEIIADPAALLHGERGLAQGVEDAVEIVGDGAHDEAVEERHLARGAGAGGDAAGGEEAEVLERREEFLFPRPGIGLVAGQRAGHAAPRVLDRAVMHGAVAILQAVFHVPDGFGDGGGETAHVRDIPGFRERTVKIPAIEVG